LSSISEFAYEVSGGGSVPPPLAKLYVSRADAGGLRLALYAPPLYYSVARRRAPATGYLLLLGDDRLTIGIDGGANQNAVVEIPFTDTICVEIGEILLLSWLKIRFGADKCRELMIPYNTVSSQLFLNLLHLLRQGIEGKSLEAEQAIPPPADLPLKFKNALHHWLVADEAVIRLAFQLEVRQPFLWFLEQQVLPPLLIALTNRQFLTLTEEPTRRFGQTKSFGTLYTYCPLSRIQALSVLPRGDQPELATLRIEMMNQKAQCVLEHTVSAEWQAKAETLVKFVNAKVALCRSTEVVTPGPLSK
jgi:hypothetical protein